MLTTTILRSRLYFVPSEANPLKYAPMPAVLARSVRWARRLTVTASRLLGSRTSRPGRTRA